MKLHKISINNLRRRKARAMFLVIGLMIGIGSIVALFSTTQILEEDIIHKMEEFGANITIVPMSQELSINYAGLNLGGISFDVKEISQSDIKKIKTIKNASNIRTISPKLFGVFEHPKGKAIIAGVNFESEFTLKPWLKIAGKKPVKNDEIMVGSDIAARFGFKLTQSIDIRGKSYRVVGIINSTGSQDDNLVFMSIAEAQQQFNKQGKVAMAEVAAHCGDCPIEEIVKQISEKIPSAKVRAVQQVVQGRMDTLAGLRKFSLGISAIVLFVGSLVVFVTMMASVNERTREIGIFSAIGFRRSHIMRIILLEAFIVSLIAGIFGYIVGIGGARLILPFFVENMPIFKLDPFVPIGSISISIVIGILASYYPAITASKMDPSEALRTL